MESNSAAYQPRGAARDLFPARDQEILIEGPAGTGKTRAVLEKVFLCAQKYAGMRALLARKTRASMVQSVLVTLHEKVLPPGHRLHRGPQRQYRQTYRLANGSELVIGGLDNADRIMSTEYDLIAVFEATEATLEDWEKLTTRLRNGVMPYQQAIADCNPGSPSHWLNVRARRGLMRRLCSRHQDNPVYWDQAAGTWTPQGTSYLATLDRLDGIRHQRLRLGQWAVSEGLVYPTFLEHTLEHPGPGFCLPSPAVRVAAGVDWGFRDPLAAVVGALCQDGGLYIVEELYEPSLTFDEVEDRLRQLRRKWRIEEMFCDPSRPDLITGLLHKGIPCYSNQIKCIAAGIAMVTQRLRSTAEPLWIYQNCAHLLREAGEYEYAPQRTGPARETPPDKFNHALDALRYLVCGLDRWRVLSGDTAADREAITAPPAETLQRLGHHPAAPQVLAQSQARQEAARRFRRTWGA